jgi:phosphomethylpyrimidine synthase
MCGPGFCSMRISDDVRKYAAEHHAERQEAILVGLEEKAREFREAGGEIYVTGFARS